MRLSLIGACYIFGFACLAVSPSAADSHLVRELDAYCVSVEGTRKGVAASQDGATNFYVQRPGELLKITLSIHSRRTVSLWHAELDAAGFDDMEERDLNAPYCAIERVSAGQMHGVQWREGETPAALIDVFAAMLAAEPNAHAIEQ